MMERMNVKELYNFIDTQITGWMARYGIVLLRLALGIVFFWFGVLKFFPGLSVAEDLVTRTISMLSLGYVPAAISLPLVAAWECAIGLGLISGRFLRLTLLLLFLQMAGTFLPLIFFPTETWTRFPHVPSLEGQYIIKNLVLLGAGIVVGATVRGGKIISEPKAAHQAEIREQAESRFWQPFRKSINRHP
jgi:uncharacterized membrane protein YphA (DoxX/SURF4 family)